ncbi:hypothetical protein RGQ29_018649 [Quercus rubra]|uniref:Uncharacterized protein n=1 Tax=Quercus rubra TaxID=3512 RepID=A0AAN7FPA1_QUERU|nr:hypothetical protein RGQ29_018649 [Quercus rubra]
MCKEMVNPSLIHADIQRWMMINTMNLDQISEEDDVQEINDKDDVVEVDKNHEEDGVDLTECVVEVDIDERDL